MGATLAGLEARGLVRRQPDPEDGRRAVLSLTEAGQQVLRDKRSARVAQLAQALSNGFTPAELRQLHDGRPAARAAGADHLMARQLTASPGDRYRWVALANTTAAMFMATLDGSIVIIALPAIFRGIHLDPLAPGNISYLLWMIMGYRLVQAVLVVSLGRLGDMFGRVKIYNAGFAVFTAASILLSFDPFQGGHGALWLIGWRVLQAIGGSMLMANSAAILTDAFPAERRGFALGTNQVAGLAGQFIGLVAGGLLAAIDWRAVFWVNVPVGVFGTLWAYRKLRDNGARNPGRIDWWGNVTFAVGLGAVLIGITDGIQPYGHAQHGLDEPVGRRAADRRRRAARGVRGDRDQDRRPDVPAEPVPDPGVHGRQHRGLRGRHRPRRPAVHAHHLAAGDLAAAARLRLQPTPRCGPASSCCR